jgi:hypothetical protein
VQITLAALGKTSFGIGIVRPVIEQLRFGYVFRCLIGNLNELYVRGIHFEIIVYIIKVMDIYRVIVSVVVEFVDTLQTKR